LWPGKGPHHIRGRSLEESIRQNLYVQETGEGGGGKKGGEGDNPITKKDYLDKKTNNPQRHIVGSSNADELPVLDRQSGERTKTRRKRKSPFEKVTREKTGKGSISIAV